ncbi:P-loop containing nucleoside triphosphate hydrolase protein, partial [Calocera viscosa TUFC12733]
RRLKRKIIMHVGPTNSGKTHQALQALVRAESGVYAGPLRLLAHEIWKRINNGAIDGIVRDCNLITGEEQRWVGEYAAHVACTVEMTPLKDWDVVVLDEIQMIADPDRGSSWMSVLLGAPAKEIHLCGEDTTVDLVTRIAKECGDEIVINRYERLSPLKIADKSLGGDLSKVQQGDAIVAFNRSFIFQLAQQVASKTGHSAALAYGALPPEVRNQQAKVFNDPNSGLSVMVASDAIGLGLNLKIKRIIFHRMTKWNGKEVIELSPSQTKQIAGRAGRFGLHGEGESGEVTTLFPADLPILRRAMGVPNSPILRGQIAPSSLIVIDFYRLLTPGTTIYDAQKVFADFTRTAPWQIASPMKQDLMFVPGENMLFQKFCQLPTDIQLDWMNSPWPKRQIWPLVAACADAFLKNYIERPEMVEIQPVLEQHGLYDPFAVIHLGRNTIRAAGAGPAMKRLLSNPRTLVYLESAHRAITFYLWLSYRFPVSFGEQLKAFELKNQVE